MHVIDRKAAGARVCPRSDDNSAVRKQIHEVVFSFLFKPHVYIVSYKYIVNILRIVQKYQIYKLIRRKESVFCRHRSFKRPSRFIFVWLQRNNYISRAGLKTAQIVCHVLIIPLWQFQNGSRTVKFVETTIQNSKLLNKNGINITLSRKLKAMSISPPLRHIFCQPVRPA